jgi:hypothetical protein
MSTNKNYVEIPPNAGRTLAALRELGYDSLAAISDIIDNSIDAEASRIDVTIKAIGKSLLIEILDDGHGMSQETLKEAIRLGSDMDGRDVKTDLGKYGMGLVTASLSIAKTIFVLTREEGKHAFEATFDVATVERQDKWVLELKPASRGVIDEIGNRGTLVRLTNVDRLDDTNVTRMGDRLRSHLGRIFRNFITGGVKITVNRRVVEVIDPLMRDHPLTIVRYDQPVDLGKGRTVRLTIVELPDLGSEDEKLGVVPSSSGFYIVRNRREIMGAQTFGFYRHHHSYSHFRAELVFGGDLDTDFHVDVKKTSVMPTEEILEKIQHVARRFIEASGREGRDRAVEKTTLTHNFARSLLTPPKTDGKAKPEIAFDESDHGTDESLFRIEIKDGSTVLDYNKRHPLVQLVAAAKLQKGIAILDCMALALAALAKEKGGDELVARFNKALSVVLSAGTSADTWAARDKATKKS